MSLRAWYIGGCVRDQLLGIDYNDIDIIVEAESFEALEQWVRTTHKKVFQVRPEFLHIKAQTHDGQVNDYTIPRRDGVYTDHRRPESTEIGTLTEDLQRRDFTCNAIARKVEADGSHGDVFDPFGGVRDLQNRQLRAVGNAYDRLDEDHLRIVRAIRFCVTKGLTPVDELEHILLQGEWSGKLSTLPVERIQAEMYKAFRFSTPATIRFLGQIHPSYTRAIFRSGLWLLPTTAKNRKPPQ